MTASQAAAAVSAHGAELVAAAIARLDSADELDVASWLRATPAGAGAAALTGIAVASRAAHALGHPPSSRWTPSALEQAGDPAVSAWRARRFAQSGTVDLTAGCGGDALALRQVASTLVACERHPARAILLQANLGGDATVRADALRPPVAASALGWADPGRRAGGRRRRALADLMPAVPALVEATAHLAGLGIAVSPATDLADPDLPDAELEFLQVGARLVSATLWLRALRDRAPACEGAPARASRSATLLPSGAHLRGEPRPMPPVAPIGAYLAEPAPALVRARLHGEHAAATGLQAVARNRALLTGDHPPDSPWLTLWQVEQVLPARPKVVRAALRGLDPEAVEIALHGLATDVELWHRQLGRPPRGPSGHRVLLIRRDADAVAVIATPVRPGERGPQRS